MNTKLIARILSFLMIFSVVLSSAACSDNADTDTPDPKGNSDDTTAAEETEEADNRFDGVDYKGREFRVYSSADATDATNANAMIEGSGELNGDIVNDAVYDRNMRVEELLGVTLTFTPANFTFDTATAGIRQLVLAGTDEFDLIINDLRSLAALSVEGMFHQVSNKGNFDFSKNYWYKDYMEDLQILPGYSYLLAGDYFMDVISSCHALFYNKTLAEDFYNDGDYIYNMVLDGTWTYDALTQITQETYVDLNGDSKANEGDLFGFSVHDTWGCAIPFVGSSGTKFIDRSSGMPELALNDERAIAYLEALNALWYSPGTLNKIKNSGDMNLGLRDLFADGKTVVVGYQRLGDLAKMRDIEFGIGIIPYPKLFVTDEYITSTHDTTEIGAIPVTSHDTDFTTTVIEVLTRETSTMLMPQYYETALKVKYTTDTMSATMIDIIHDSFGSTFPLAFEQSLSGILIASFTDNLGTQSNAFASTYATKEKVATKSLEKLIEKALEIAGSEQ